MELPLPAAGVGPEGLMVRKRGGSRAIPGNPWRPVAFPAMVLLFVFGLLAAETGFRLDPEIIVAAEDKFGKGAKERLLAWERLIADDSSQTDFDRLEKVNSFFNCIPFVSDAEHWLKADYWATPIEFLATNGGDCEDFSLAKYFTLKLLGISEEKLKLTYVKAWRINQAHMVVTYYSTPDAEPLVLDNLVDTIELASRRDDLLPVYSFNGVGLWLSKERGRGKHIGGSNRLSLWNDVLNRIPESLK